MKMLQGSAAFEMEIRRGEIAVAMTENYAAQEPSRAEVDTLEGATLLEFGSTNCGYCRAAQPLLGHALADHPDIRHLKIEDGSGRRLGRTYGVKLWPTFVFLRDGKELARLVRPLKAEAFREALGHID